MISLLKGILFICMLISMTDSQLTFLSDVDLTFFISFNRIWVFQIGLNFNLYFIVILK